MLVIVRIAVPTNVQKQFLDVHNIFYDLNSSVRVLREKGWHKFQPDVFALLLHKVGTATLVADDGTGKMMPLALQTMKESERMLKEIMGAPVDTVEVLVNTTNFTK